MIGSSASEFDFLGDVDQGLPHPEFDGVIHGLVLGEDQPLELVVRGIDGVAESLLEEVGGPAAHSLDEGLGSTQIPVHQAWGWVDVGINGGLRDVADLVTGATKSHNLVRGQSVNDLLHGVTEVGEGGSYFDFVVLSWLLHVEGLKVLDITDGGLVHAHVLIVDYYVSYVRKSGSGFLLMFCQVV